jgi:hypothetical protein
VLALRSISIPNFDCLARVVETEREYRSNTTTMLLFDIIQSFAFFEDQLPYKISGPFIQKAQSRSLSGRVRSVTMLRTCIALQLCCHVWFHEIPSFDSVIIIGLTHILEDTAGLSSFVNEGTKVNAICIAHH